jgi:transposase, IS30 family
MKHITIEQRYQIEAYLKLKMSKDFISTELGIHRSSVYREISRNKLKNGGYSAKSAHEYSVDRKDRFSFNRNFTDECEATVKGFLKDDWSPKQIVGYCLNNSISMVSHERIYQFIRLDKQRGGDLFKHCRHQLKHRKRPVGKHYPISNRISIDERPQVVNDKTRFGDWEMDTIIGAHQQGAILTLTERKTNFIFIRKLENGKNAKSLKDQVNEILLPYKDFVHTITTDNGPEFAEHLEINKKLKTTVYFAHPYCSWEKGSIEHANKLIRQYVKKDSNLNDYTQVQLTDIQHKLNNRPREKLNFESPKNIYYNLVRGNVAFGT